MSIQFHKNHFQNIITPAPHSYFVSSNSAKILSQQKRVDPVDLFGELQNDIRSIIIHIIFLKIQNHLRRAVPLPE